MCWHWVVVNWSTDMKQKPPDHALESNTIQEDSISHWKHVAFCFRTRLSFWVALLVILLLWAPLWKMYVYDTGLHFICSPLVIYIVLPFPCKDTLSLNIVHCPSHPQFCALEEAPQWTFYDVDPLWSCDHLQNFGYDFANMSSVWNACDLLACKYRF